MMVSPELMSAKSTPSTSPLNICDARLTQLITTDLAEGGLARAISGIIAELAPKGVRRLHQRLAGHDLGNLPEVLLVLHVGGFLAANDNDGTHQLVVGGAPVDLTQKRLDLAAGLVGFDDIGRIEGAGVLDRLCP